MDSAFLFLLLTFYPDFNCLLSKLNSPKSKKEAKDFFPGSNEMIIGNESRSPWRIRHNHELQ
jgi:hypothetical protein